MSARIYRPAKNAMQSGQAHTRRWVLDFDPAAPRQIEPLMGWTSSSDMQQQLRLTFETKEDAIAYAKRNGIAYLVQEPRVRMRRPKAYSDNFRFGRNGLWTH